MILIAAIVLWVLYSSIEGIREARHFYYRISSNRQDTHNEHSLFAIQRIIAWIPFECMMYNSNNNLTALNGIFLALMFVLFHDGFYYRKYNKLAGNYPLGFWSQTSTTSNSWWDVNGLTGPVFRVTYAVVGLLGLIIINYANY